jgi:hypothetical protein
MKVLLAMALAIGFMGVVSQHFAAVKARYLQCQHDARHGCERDFSPLFGRVFTLSEISQRALLAVSSQWEPNGRPDETRWDWTQVLRGFRSEWDRLEVAIWSDERLCGLALAITGGKSVNLRFLEGDPRKDCPLKGKRIMIALDVCARYAQGRGKAELRIEPINSDLEELYVGTYGFLRRSLKGEQPHLFRQV